MKSRISSVFSTFLQISGSQKKSQTYSNLQTGFDEIHWLNGIVGWPCHHLPKARQLLAWEELGVRENRQVLFFESVLDANLSSIRPRTGPRTNPSDPN